MQSDTKVEMGPCCFCGGAAFLTARLRSLIREPLPESLVLFHYCFEFCSPLDWQQS
jgi:hypothetical protein